jgi:glucose-6-phosphate isomerase
LKIQLYNAPPVSPSESLFGKHILGQLEALDSKIRRKGLESLDASRNRLIAIGTEHDGKRVTKNGYGVLNLSWQAAKHHAEWARTVGSELDEIRERIKAAHDVPLQFLIWAGMGGSSEDKSAYIACGLMKKGVRGYVLDSTDPAKLKFILEDIGRRSGLTLKRALQRTLVVGMAMGMTSYEPVVNLEKLAELYDRERVKSTANFLYMTLPDSLLDQFAAKRGYRRVPLQLDDGNTTAGRHSSPLTRGSLYPLGLAGVDLGAWIAGAALSAEDIERALELAAFLDAEGQVGRDKVTLLLPKAWAGIGIWTKQNFEESLGKSEAIGIKIVTGESVTLRNYRAPKSPKQDRVFLSVQVQGGGPSEHAAKLQTLRRAGYPVAVVTFPKGALLSTYMQFMHYAVFGLGWLRQMNFVTQPGVELYKSITSRLYAKGGGDLAPGMKYGRDLILNTCLMPEGKQSRAPEALAHLIADRFLSGAVSYGELSFFGDTRYSTEGRLVRKSLERAAGSVFRSLLKAPADVYEGPAMNHSYHEMIIGHGRCFSIVLASEHCETIERLAYDAGYHKAQFEATQMALAERGRAVVSLTLKNLEPRTIRELDEFFRETAQCLKDLLKRGARTLGHSYNQN